MGNKVIKAETLEREPFIRPHMAFERSTSHTTSPVNRGSIEGMLFFKFGGMQQQQLEDHLSELESKCPQLASMEGRAVTDEHLPDVLANLISISRSGRRLP